MSPCYFGAPDSPLFGLYTPPRVSVARAAGVLLCAPIGLEYLRTHYALRLLSMRLADAGFHVLRFDYHGTGDSAGEIGSGQFGTWVDDVRLALDELEAISGAPSLHLVGLRMGAVLALEAIAKPARAVDGLVLWDPIPAGALYLDALERMQSQMVDLRGAAPEPTDELLGARYPADLRVAIRGVDVHELLRTVGVRSAALVVSENPAQYSALQAEMTARWADLDYRLVGDPVRWEDLKAAFDARMTGPVVRVVAEAVERLA